MRFIGLDVHKRMIEVAIIDEAGKLLGRDTVSVTHGDLMRFAKSLSATDKVVLEATTNTWAIYAFLLPYVDKIAVANPMKTRAIAEAKVKTDKVDALILAQLLRTEFLATVWAPDEATMELRQLTTRRAALVSDRTRLKNRVHAILHQRLIQIDIRPDFDSS